MRRVPSIDVLHAFRREGVSVVLSTLVAGQALGVVSGILLARGLGPHGRGELATVILWPMLLAALGELSISDAVVYFTARGEVRRETLIGTALASLGVQSLLIIGIGAALLPTILAGHSSHTVHLALAMLAIVPLNLFSTLSSAVFLGLQRFRLGQVLRLSIVGTTTLLVVVLVVAHRLSVDRAAAAYVLANAVGACAGALSLRGLVTGRLTVDKTLVRPLLAYAAKSHTATVTTTANQRLDQLVLSVALAPAQLGLYVVAVTVASGALLIGTALGTVALPAIAATRSVAEQIATLRRYLRASVAADAVVTMVLIAFTPAILSFFFGANFSSASTATRILLVATVFSGAGRVASSTLAGLGRPLSAGNAQAVGLIVTVAGLAVLIPPFGITGAAVTSLLAYGTSLAWMLHRAVHALEIRPLELVVARRHTPPESLPHDARPGTR